jgi:hypothetical protein
MTSILTLNPVEVIDARSVLYLTHSDSYRGS